MPAAAKWLFILTLNTVFSGFFGLGVAALHFFWLEYATVRWPRVSYTEEYQTAFALVCGAVVFVIITVRQINTRLASKSLRPSEIGFVLVFIVIVMVGMTPVPGSNFPAYLYERNYAGKKQPNSPTVKQPEPGRLDLKRSGP
ncbi:MAG: hypothetical protein ABS95_02385 [Verrucomicrobia bacterium SCN 57-15]|nr:MAG: hypothetical protein ABS95_02385 [Verrucomicrobia bacterium SCN 57-15]